MNNEYEGLVPFVEYRGVAVYKTDNFDGLPEDTMRVLEPQLVEAAAQGFCRPITDEFSADVSAHIRGGDLLVVTNGQADGFALMQKYTNLDAIYIAGVVKSPLTQSHIIEFVIGKYLEEQNCRFVAVRTQNDRVVEIMARFCPILIPFNVPISEEYLNILENMNLITSNVSQRTLIASGHYGSPMIGSNIRRRTLNAHIKNFMNELSYEAGDARVLLGVRS